MLALLGVSYVMDLDPNIVTVATVIGLGLSLDYALLYVSRFREERLNGRDVAGAIERSAATAGRSVAFSALTVIASICGLFVFTSPIYHAIGAAGVAVSALAVLASLTLTPALLGLFGRRIRLPRRQQSDVGMFARVARGVQRTPVASAWTVAIVLITLGLPFLTVRFANSGPEHLPKSFESRQVADTVDERFRVAGTESVTVVARTDALSLKAYGHMLRKYAYLTAIREPQQLGPGVSRLELIPIGSGKDDIAEDLVRYLRANRPTYPIYVTGPAAILIDFRDELAERMPWALLVIAVSTFVLLFLMTGSLLVPLKALIMNTLSLGAAFGALVLVLQRGMFADLLGFTPVGAIETWVPVLVFAFAFGLSMDYEVFLLTRIKEYYDQGLSNNDAVAAGLQRSGRIITSAALVMVTVVAGFAAGKMLAIKELGLALAIAVAVDATLVRCVLVPATMTVLGDWNWWAPGPLRRLHTRYGLRHGEAEPPVKQLARSP